ncbi:MAG: hypothetical protein JWP81_4764 [Ferruginibacter sp.]|nr:hypothetical protein [Ferruginibacter sp.]
MGKYLNSGKLTDYTVAPRHHFEKPARYSLNGYCSVALGYQLRNVLKQ